MKKLFALLLAFATALTLFACGNEPQPESSSEPQSSLPLSQYGFDYEIVDDSVRIIQCWDYGREIYVPDEIGGKPVKAIATDAFYQHKDTEKIVLPDGLTSIESAAFYRCYSLAEITIPSSVEQIEDDPFFRCTSLTAIHVEDGNAVYCDIDGVLYNKDKTALIVYPEGNAAETYTVPDSVVRIEGGAFGYHCHAMKTLVIKSNVTELPDGNMFVFPDEILLMVESGSAAEKYAKEQGLNYKIID